MTWYRIRWGTVIEPVTVTKFTAKTVTLAPDGGYEHRPRRANRHSDWEDYFETQQEAIDHLRKRLYDRVTSIRDELDKAQQKVAEFDAQYPPGGAA